jgi:hypothetical protein
MGILFKGAGQSPSALRVRGYGDEGRGGGKKEVGMDTTEQRHGVNRELGTRANTCDVMQMYID